MIVIPFGGGSNSTALTIEWVRLGNPIDLVIFADTGGERPETYAHIKEFSEWLTTKGHKGIVTVQTQYKNGDYFTLEEHLIRTKSLPSIAYGFKTCSEKHKIRPVNKYLNNMGLAKKTWKGGGKVTKLIGFDAGEDHRVRDFSDNKYNIRFPLIEWDLDRDDCIEIIRSEGLTLPGKSSCFFCPSMRPNEIRALQAMHPGLVKRALDIESNAELTSIKGLGRNWAWRDLLATDDMFGDDSFTCLIEQDCGCYDG